MKKTIIGFVYRGVVACGLGPIVLAVFYLLLQQHSGVHTLTVNQVCTGIFSLSALAFVAGGMNVIYQVERLPLMVAILIHGVVLYVSYLVTYLVNGWLELGILPVVVFTGIFIGGYLLIWLILSFMIKKHTRRLNESLKRKQHRDEDSVH